MIMLRCLAAQSFWGTAYQQLSSATQADSALGQGVPDGHRNTSDLTNSRPVWSQQNRATFPGLIIITDRSDRARLPLQRGPLNSLFLPHLVDSTLGLGATSRVSPL